MKCLVIGKPSGYSLTDTDDVTVVRSREELDKLITDLGHRPVRSISEACEVLKSHFDIIAQDFFNFLDNKV